jgi:hypothetical protein
MYAEEARREAKRYPSRRSPVDWAPGEREALIAEALAKGRVTVVPRGQSGSDEGATRRSFNETARRQ